MHFPSHGIQLVLKYGGHMCG